MNARGGLAALVHHTGTLAQSQIGLRPSSACSPVRRDCSLEIIDAGHMLDDAVALIVIPVPSRGRPWAEGYNEQKPELADGLAMPFLRCLVRNCSNESGNQS
jgi:hypothetical protein